MTKNDKKHRDGRVDYTDSTCDGQAYHEKKKWAQRLGDKYDQFSELTHARCLSC